MTAPVSSILTYNEIDDVIYYARAGELDMLKTTIHALSQAKSCSVSEIILAAIDIDEDGLGSGSCLLHYPAANGNLEVVEYLISAGKRRREEKDGEIGVNGFRDEKPIGHDDDALLLRQEENEAWIKFVNHQNVSGNTPLHWAGVNGHLHVVKALMKVDADPGIVNSTGRDAVFESDISSKEGAAECAVEMLKVYEGLEKSNRADDSQVIEGQEYAFKSEDATNTNQDHASEASTVINATSSPS